MDGKMAFLSAAENRDMFFQRIKRFLPVLDPRYQLIEKAYNASKDAFRGKQRESGERYFEHLRGVALILIEHLRIKDHILIATALLHDIVEDSEYWTIERVQIEFGDEIALLVEWLTKPPKDSFATKEERDAMYHGRFQFAPRKFFLVKLADRLHNLLTLEVCSPEKQERKICETEHYYLPYAERELILLHELEDAIKRIKQKPEGETPKKRRGKS